MRSDSTCVNDGTIDPGNDRWYCEVGNFLYCDAGTECDYYDPWRCLNTDGSPTGWEWRPYGGPSENTETLCTDGWDNDCQNGADCADPSCLSGGFCAEDCTNQADDDRDGWYDYCDTEDCSCAPGQQLRCTCATVTASAANVPTGTTVTLTYTPLGGDSRYADTCVFHSGDGGSSHGSCLTVRDWDRLYDSPGTFTPYMRNLATGEQVDGPQIFVGDPCPGSLTHSSVFLGCHDVGYPNSETDPSYYCPGSELCTLCSAGYLWSSVHNNCAKDPCTDTGEGCTWGMGSHEQLPDPLGYCANTLATCVECTAGGSWDQWCNNCYETCPDGVQDGEYSGCITTSPSNAQRVSSWSGGCYSGAPIYACDQGGGVGGPSSDYICWQCDTGYHWDTSAEDCVADCGQSGASCTGFLTGECCSGLYCSQHKPGGDPIPLGQYHCCPDGGYWSEGFSQCRQEQLCYDPGTLCDYPSNFPFNPPGAWWNEILCIDQTKACCWTSIFGDDDYHYLWNLAY